eukprot:4409764-Pyramimonas_sp.AAC.1
MCRDFARCPPIAASWAPRGLGGRIHCNTLHSSFNQPACSTQIAPHRLHHIAYTTQLAPHSLHHIAYATQLAPRNNR